MDFKNITSRYKFPALWLVVFVIMLLPTGFVAKAQGDLLVYPKRLVFEGRTRVQRITLSNTGNDVATYSVSLIEYRMTETGDFVRISEPDTSQYFASPYLRVFPRKVELRPHESQTVKVQLVNTEKMNDGEYRSHLYLRAEKEQAPLGQKKKDDDLQTISVQLQPVFGISLATIIRKGTSNTETSISSIAYSSDELSNHFLHFNINRSGNMSTYGDITINYFTSSGKKYEVAVVKGIAVYTPTSVRKIKMLIEKPNKVDFNAGRFEVVYRENGKKTVITKADIEL